MIIAIDAGNTRIKWAVHDGVSWISQGALATVDAEKLSDVSTGWPVPARVIACNVAGERIEKVIRSALAAFEAPQYWLQSSQEACGVSNSYDQPGQLGADRWAAMIGARGLICGNSLVVCAGTATTVDWVDAEGVFRGGLILPGFELMRSSLALNTAQLPRAEGEYCSAPRNTMDAIVSGCLYAQIGAIERMFHSLPAGSETLCLLTGGAAQLIIPHLSIPFLRVENLILDGLVRFASSK